MSAIHVTLYIAISVLVLICVGLVLVVRLHRRQGELIQRQEQTLRQQEEQVQATEELIKEVAADRLQRVLEEPRVNGRKRPTDVKTSITRGHLGLVREGGLAALGFLVADAVQDAWREHPRAVMASAASFVAAGAAGTVLYLGGGWGATEAPIGASEPRPATSAPRESERPSRSSRPSPSPTDGPSAPIASSPSSPAPMLVPSASPTATETSTPTVTTKPSPAPSKEGTDAGSTPSPAPDPRAPDRPDRPDRGDGRPDGNDGRPGTQPDDDRGDDGEDDDDRGEDREDRNDPPGEDEAPCLVPMVDVPLDGLLDGLLCDD